MALPHKSVATVDNIEFVNLAPTDVSPMISKCEIKVFYLGKNRNGSFINKQVATQMAASLRGCPIVGYYNQEKQDFRDHGQKVTLDGDGIHFECQTQPYGFVAPDADVWFQDFNEQDDFGQPVTRTYLVTNGYLWTGQFKEAQQVLDDGGKPHSMELDDKTLDGHWSYDDKGMEFFIISDAMISKLCILGDDVEPCFEGSAITAPATSQNFTLGMNTLIDMAKQLKFALNKGDNMAAENQNVKPEENKPTEEFSQDNSVKNQATENQSTTEGNNSASTPETFEKKNDDANNDGAAAEGEGKEEEGTDNGSGDDKNKKPEAKNSLHTDEEFDELNTKYTDLQSKFTEMSAEMEKLTAFKTSVENKEKDALIAKFYMLSDEDKKDVIEHKSEYTLDEIEAKLSVIGYHKGVNFSLGEGEEEKKPTENFTVNINNSESNATPDWVSAALDAQKNL